MILNIEHNNKVIYTLGLCADINPEVKEIPCDKCINVQPVLKRLTNIVLEKDCYQEIKINIDP